ncbi:MAG TPA: TetR family transcriptional regulator [Bryobacteraceae bacterium]|nr:TetR family transcriptional regulator [Bryobacteraceae bacterium]
MPTAPSDTPTVDRLLDTAAELFWEKGFAATTTREIAAALGIQQASLYYHMASKEDLLYQIFGSSLHQFLADVPAAVQQVSDPRERIRVLIRAHIFTLLRYQKRNMTMLTELRALSPRHRAEVVALRKRYADFVRATIEDAQANGAMRGDIPAGYLSLGLLNMLNWAARWYRQNRDPTPEQVAELFFKLYSGGAASARAHKSLRMPDWKAPVSGKSVAARPRKQSRPADSTVQRLLDAAVALFSRQGYAATSTREVAALLGIQKASLYYHIQSKEDLLYFICKSTLEQIRDDVETALADVADPLERTSTLISTHVESMLRSKDEHATTLTEMYALSKDRLASIVLLREGYVDLVRSVLREAQQAGALREDIDARYLALALMGLLNRVLVWYRRRGPLSPGQLGQLLAMIFLAGVAPVKAGSRLTS